MSGIYGAAGLTDMAACLAVLEKKNHMYGTVGSDRYEGAGFAMGCCMEQAGCAVLQAGDARGVIDALLYNREELLPLAGVDAQANDAEILFRLILQKGPDVLKQVNGDFAGAIYFENTSRWLLFRDHLGVRPLYTYQKEHAFAFSTDLRGLLALPGADLMPDERQMYLRIMGGDMSSAEATDFACCRMLKAGHYTWLTADGARQENTYYVPGKKKKRLIRRKQCEEKLYALVEDAVKRRLSVFSGPVGAEMSGGLDSAVIDVLIHRAGREAKYLSWSPPVEDVPLQEGDERLMVEALCNQEGLVCHFLPSDRHTQKNIFHKPFPPFVHTLQLSNTAAWMAGQGVKAVFSGHGGDEGASHRSNIYELWHHGEYLAYAREWLHNHQNTRLRPIRLLLHLLRQARAGQPYVHPWWCRNGNKPEWLADEFREKMQDTALPPLAFAYDPRQYVQNGGLRLRLDNAAFQGAEQGVRYVFPLLDYRVVDFSLAIPRRMFLKKGKDRLVFRGAFASLLPEAVCRQQRKDSPGMNSVHSQEEDEAYFRNTLYLLDALDHRWDAWWNMELVRSCRSCFMEKECALDVRHVNDLYICWLMQQWQDGAWADA